MMNHYGDMNMFQLHPFLYVAFWTIAIVILLLLVKNFVKK